MKIYFVIFLVTVAGVSATAQKLLNVEGKLIIDSTLTTSLTQEAAFNAVKKWMILNIEDYKSMQIGEVEREMLACKSIVKYWAAMGGKQKYIQDINVSFEQGKVHIRISNLYTLATDGSKGWSADKFFIKSDGTLKSMGNNWYADVADKFRAMCKTISVEVN